MYTLDNELIDSEHEKLFEIASQALDIKGEQKKDKIRKILIELNEYMKTHFEDEEEYMKSIDFFDIERHKIIHENIIEQMNEFIKQLPTLSIDQFERKLIEYMDIWLINHIIVEDKKITCNQ